MAHSIPRERARAILTTYLRVGLEAAGHRWNARNDRHVDELLRCLQEIIDEGNEEGGFAAELDTPAHPARAGTFIGRRDEDGGMTEYRDWRRKREAS